MKLAVLPLVCSILFALACETRADISNLVPTTVSGGSGTVGSIQADDGVFYSAAKNNTINIGGFPAVGGDISSVVLHLKFTVQAGGYSGTKAILVNGVGTGIVPSNADTERSASVDLTSYGLICVHLTAGIFRIVI